MQGFNMGRYVPPDQEGTISGNRLHSKLPPGHRASKPGVQTVRFEMPYAIWCDTCPKPTIIGQGVRFNAEKRRTGSYHTTPIWTFRLRHADCGGAIEIRTDPQSTTYVVVSGARKRDTGIDETVGPGSASAAGELAILTEGERQSLRKSAFASLERTIEDREALKAATERLDDLQDLSKRQWEDPGARNSALRRTFRVGRKEREEVAARDEDVRERMGLGIELVPFTEEDALRAALVDFGERPASGAGLGESGHGDEEAKVLTKPLFGKTSSSTKGNEAVRRGETKKRSNGKTSLSAKGKPKAEILASKKREGIVSEIVGNTRRLQDPFLVGGTGMRLTTGASQGRTNGRIPGVKRKRAVEESHREEAQEDMVTVSVKQEKEDGHDMTWTGEDVKIKEEEDEEEEDALKGIVKEEKDDDTDMAIPGHIKEEPSDSRASSVQVTRLVAYISDSD